MLDNVNQEIPKTLLHFLEEVIVNHLKTKCTSISHAIMAAIQERSFSSQNNSATARVVVVRDADAGKRACNAL